MVQGSSKVVKSLRCRFEGHASNNGDLQLPPQRRSICDSVTQRGLVSSASGESTRFALACNISSKIIEPIQPWAKSICDAADVALRDTCGLVLWKGAW